MVRGVLLVGIPVSDQDVALDFYIEKLGFRIATDRPDTDSQRWIELSIPGAETRLALFIPQGREDRIGQLQSVSFWCDDVITTCAILASRGVVFAQEPQKNKLGFTAILKDPDGNAFVLSSRGKSKARATSRARHP